VVVRRAGVWVRASFGTIRERYGSPPHLHAAAGVSHPHPGEHPAGRARGDRCVRGRQNVGGEHRRAGDVSDAASQPFAAGHESAAITAPSTRWFLAEGAAGRFFDLFTLLANFSATDANVGMQYLLLDGTTDHKTYVVSGKRPPDESASTFRAFPVSPNQTLSRMSPRRGL
jgi:hypothetical protein